MAPTDRAGGTEGQPPPAERPGAPRGSHAAWLAGHYAARYGDRSVLALNRSARARAQLFARWIGTGKRLLDLGCGPGTVLEVYAAGNVVTGMDVDPSALDSCRKRLGIATVWGDFATRLPFADGTFEVVVAGETLEHMPYPDAFLVEIHRVLDAGGLFIGSSPNAYRYRNRVRVLFGHPLDRDPTHVQCFSLVSLRALLARHFAVEDIVPIRGRWATRSPSLFAHYFGWRCRRRS